MAKKKAWKLQALIKNLFRSRTYMITLNELDTLLRELNEHEKRQKKPVDGATFQLPHLVLALRGVAFREERQRSGFKRVVQNEVLALWLMSEPFVETTAELQGVHNIDPVIAKRCRYMLAFTLGYHGPGFSSEAMSLDREGWNDGIEQRSADFPHLNPLTLVKQARLTVFQRSARV